MHKLFAHLQLLHTRAERDAIHIVPFRRQIALNPIFIVVLVVRDRQNPTLAAEVPQLACEHSLAADGRLRMHAEPVAVRVGPEESRRDGATETRDGDRPPILDEVCLARVHNADTRAPFVADGRRERAVWPFADFDVPVVAADEEVARRHARKVFSEREGGEQACEKVDDSLHRHSIRRLEMLE